MAHVYKLPRLERQYRSLPTVPNGCSGSRVSGLGFRVSCLGSGLSFYDIVPRNPILLRVP